MKWHKAVEVTCLVAAAASLVVACSVVPGLASERPTTEFAVAALQAQADASGPSLDVTYTWTPLAAQKEGSTRATIRYVRTPAFLLFQEKSERLDGTGSWLALDSSRSVHNRVTKDNRQVGTSAADGTSVGRISTGTVNRFTSQPMIDIVYYPLLTVPLIERISKGTIAGEQEPIDGHACWRVDIPQEPIGTNHGSSVGWTVWLDPEVGLCPRLIVDHYYKAGAVSEEVTRGFADYKSLGNGVFLPMSHVVKYRDGNGIVLNVDKAAIGEGIPDAEFTVVFAPGTKVFNLPQGGKKPMSYVVQ